MHTQMRDRVGWLLAQVMLGLSVAVIMGGALYLARQVGTGGGHAPGKTGGHGGGACTFQGLVDLYLYTYVDMCACLPVRACVYTCACLPVGVMFVCGHECVCVPVCIRVPACLWGCCLYVDMSVCVPVCIRVPACLWGCCLYVDMSVCVCA